MTRRAHLWMACSFGAAVAWAAPPVKWPLTIQLYPAVRYCSRNTVARWRLLTQSAHSAVPTLTVRLGLALPTNNVRSFGRIKLLCGDRQSGWTSFKLSCFGQLLSFDFSLDVYPLHRLNSFLSVLKSDFYKLVMTTRNSKLIYYAFQCFLVWHTFGHSCLESGLLALSPQYQGCLAVYYWSFSLSPAVDISRWAS